MLESDASVVRRRVKHIGHRDGAGDIPVAEIQEFHLGTREPSKDPGEISDTADVPVSDETVLIVFRLRNVVSVLVQF